MLKEVIGVGKNRIYQIENILGEKVKIIARVNINNVAKVYEKEVDSSLLVDCKVVTKISLEDHYNLLNYLRDQPYVNFKKTDIVVQVYLLRAMVIVSDPIIAKMVVDN